MNLSSSSSKRRGFTLIELLVVIAIIGLLAAVVLASLSNSNMKGRDARRMEDMTQIRNALELYATTYGHYPVTSGGAWASFDAPSYVGTAIVSPAAANLATALKPFMGGTPSDPKNNIGGDAGYLYVGGGNDYCFMIYKTPEDLRNYKSSMIDPSRCTSINSSTGQCSSAGGSNAVYFGTGIYDGVGC